MKCAIFTIARMENDYILEWVNYHLNIGFDKIFLFDNNYSGEDTFEDILSDYIRNGTVQVIDIRNKFAMQEASYNYALKNLCYEYNWNAFIDVDEFITFKKSKDAKTFFNDEKFKNTDIIFLNWMLYGDDGKIRKENGNVQDRIKNPLPLDKRISFNFPENYHIKTLINGKSKLLDTYKFTWNPHCPSYGDEKTLCKNGNGIIISDFKSPFQEYNYDDGYIRHYATKTLEEFIRIKMKRGFPEGKLDIGLNWFWKRNEKTVEKEEFARKLIENIKENDDKKNNSNS
jgi:hypothetical protein